MEKIARARQGLSVQELEKEIELHRSSIYRYLSVLKESGYVKRENGRYQLGFKVLELAFLLLDRLDIRKIAHPYLIELSEITQATVHLCQLDGAEVVYLDKVETSRSLPLYSRIGGRAPAYCTGVGKALLAFLPPKRLERVLGQITFKHYTDRTITDKERLLRELAETKRRGYALDKEEHEEGIQCVAAPIFGFTGEPIASISVTDIARKIVGKEKELAAEVVRIAKGISHAMGGETLKRKEVVL